MNMSKQWDSCVLCYCLLLSSSRATVTVKKWRADALIQVEKILLLTQEPVHHEACKAKCLERVNIFLPAGAPHVSFFLLLLTLSPVTHLNGIELQGVWPV